MDNVLKSKFNQLKDKFNFHLDLKNIKFYKRIKSFYNQTVFLSGASSLAFILSLWILNGFISLGANLLISVFFIPLFLAYLKKLNLRYQFKFTLLSEKLPRLFRLFSFIKSAEDSFFFSRDKISKMLVDENCQLVFYDFFNMAKNNIFKFDEQKRFTQNIVSFKTFLEAGNFNKAADYFIELYGASYQFEYLIHDDYQNSHDIQLLKARKKIIEEFLHQSDIEDLAKELQYKTLSVSKTNHSETKTKVNWKKLMDE